ncbi:Fusaric acid resistance protein-like-domain-containing protein [Dipodascopsis uninucleata]
MSDPSKHSRNDSKSSDHGRSWSSITTSASEVGTQENIELSSQLNSNNDDIQEAQDTISSLKQSAVVSPSHRYKLLRNDSLILPYTGERVRRQITLSEDDFEDLSGSRHSSEGHDIELDDTRDSSIDASAETAHLFDVNETVRDMRLERLPMIVRTKIWCMLAYDRMVALLESIDASRPLKCAFTYFLASLTVFWGLLSPMFGSGDGKHLTATVVVYFHPSRTVGSMIESTLFAEVALLYSALLSFSTMEIGVIFKNLDLEYIGFAIILIFFCAGGLGSIALMKQKVGKQNFNTACSLASTSFATILIREGSVQAGKLSFERLKQVSITVNFGIFIAASVCFLIHPRTANRKLKESMNKIMDLHSHMLSSITRSLVGGVNTSSLKEIDIIMNGSQATYSIIETSYHDAKFEHYVFGSEVEFFIQGRLVKSIQHIMQHLGGLRSSLATQLILNSAPDNGGNILELLDIFVSHLGPPLKSLTFTVKTILEALPYNENSRDMEIQYQPNFKPSLQQAIELFSTARSRALKDIYSRDFFKSAVGEPDMAVDMEEVASSWGQMSNVLVDLSKELDEMLTTMEDYDVYVNSGRGKSWWWLRFWAENPKNVQRTKPTLENVSVPAKFSRLFNDDGINKNENGDENISFGLKLWRFLRVFRRNDIRYGIKVGFGALVIALPAYIPETRPLMTHFRAEWALVSFVIVMNMTIGSVTSLAGLRIIGTGLGAFTAFVAWTIFGANPVLLSLTGFLTAFLCFYVILGKNSENSSFGRYVLLTFNLTALYSYSLSQNDIPDGEDDDEGGIDPIVSEIALHRMIAVTSGVILGLVITFGIWPNSARSDLKRKLGILWIQMGLIWNSDPLSCIIVDGGSVKPSINLQDEQRLQQSLMSMRSLLNQASKEYRLKGSFPTTRYEQLLSYTDAMFSSYHNLNSMILKDLNASPREAEIIAYTRDERKELSSRLFLLFYLIASAIRLGLPLPSALPNTDHARDRMIAKVNKYRMKQVASDHGSDDDFVLFYAYILSTLAIDGGLHDIIRLLQELFGSIEEETLSI